MSQALLTARIKTPLGIAEITGNSQEIFSIKLLEEQELVQQDIPADLVFSVQQLQSYFAGELKEFELKLNPEGTPFQKKVWRALQNIPYGTTCSYLELSRRLGDEKAIRAVAAANAKNPVWIVIPCHRVIGTNGSLTGYAGGIWRKKWLLEHENPPIQTQLFQ